MVRAAVSNASVLGLAFCIALSASIPSFAATKGLRATQRTSTLKSGGGRTLQSAFRDKKIFKGKITADVAAGEKLLLSGKYSDAADAFRKALNKNSKDSAALEGLGFALALQFKLDGADEQFSKALKLNGKDPMALIGKAFVQVNRLQSSNMTIISQRQNLLAQAESECRSALQIDPQMPEAMNVLAMTLKEQGRYDEALQQLNKSIQIDPTYSMSYTQRGMIELLKGDTSSSESDFKQAISLRSSNSTAQYGLGKTYLAQGKVDDALKQLNTALSLNRNSAPTHIALGDCYRKQGNTVAAVKEYQQAISIKAENESAYLGLADIREDRGDLELALSEVRSGLTLNPGSIELHKRAGDLALRLEKTDDAIREYTTALSMSPADTHAVEGMTQAYVIKAQKEATGAYFLSNNFDDAERMIQQAIKLNPNNMQLRLADAKIRAMSGADPIDLSTLGTPSNDAERIAYAQAALAEFKYDVASQQMNAVLANCQDSKQTFAIADIALMSRDLDSAEAAYKKGAGFPDGAARAQRGLAAVATARDKARQEYTLANDLASKKQLASGIDHFRTAAYQNPRMAEAHLGLADALKKFFSNRPASLREAALHYRAYISLSPNMPEKEKEKFEKKATGLTEKAFKIEQKQKRKGIK